METHKDCYISGKAGPVHAFSPESYVVGAIYKQGRGSSIEEVTRFALPSFKMTDRDACALSGLVKVERALLNFGLHYSRSDSGAKHFACRNGAGFVRLYFYIQALVSCGIILTGEMVLRTCGSRGNPK